MCINVGEFKKFFESIKNKPQPSVIEYIRDGASMKALLLKSMTVSLFIYLNNSHLHLHCNNNINNIFTICKF